MSELYKVKNKINGTISEVPKEVFDKLIGLETYEAVEETSEKVVEANEPTIEVEVEETTNAEVVEEKQEETPNEMEELKAEAKQLGLKGSHFYKTPEKLRAKIQEAKAEKEDVVEEIPSI